MCICICFIWSLGGVGNAARRTTEGKADTSARAERVGNKIVGAFRARRMGYCGVAVTSVEPEPQECHYSH